MKERIEVTRITFNEHDQTWNMMNEIDKLESDIENTTGLEGRFINSKKIALINKEKKLNRYLTHPDKAKALEWKYLVHKEYLKKTEEQKKNQKRMIRKIMEDIQAATGKPFPVSELEVIKYIVNIKRSWKINNYL